MKIDNSVQPLSSGRSSGAGRASENAAAKTSPGTAVAQAAKPSNIVQIGEAAVANLSEASSSYNAERVAEIKKAIAEGRFKVDAEKIADGLLSSVREMLNRNNNRAA